MQNEIIETVKAMFSGADEHDWDKVKNTLAGHVLLDYSELSGTTGSTLTPDVIINAWKGLLPGFDKTHHQPADFRLIQKGNTATVHYFAKADHFLGDESWIFKANYDTELVKADDDWKIISHKISNVKQSGNKELPVKTADIT
jgi:hypothetical protein